MAVADLAAAFKTFQTDFSKFATDVTAKLTALEANQANPADAATIASITTGIQALDTQVQGMDAALNPPAGGGGTGGV